MSMDTMTPRERMQALLKKEPIDRIPVSASASLYAARISGILYKEYWTDPVQSFRAQSLAAELHGYDDTPSYSYGWSDWAGWDFGGDIRIPEEDSGYPEVMNRPVQKPEDIDKLITPDPRIAPVSSMRLKAAKMNWEKSGKVSLNVNVTSMVGSIIGNEKMMRWYHTEPSAVHALYRKATDYSLAIFELYFQEFGAENCSVMETFPLDSQNVISTELFSRFGYKYIKEINEFMCNAGVKRCHLHLCGNHTANLPYWKTIPVPPRTVISIGSEMDIKDTADYFGDDYVISGNVPTTLLQIGTPEEVMESCREIIEQVKYHPGGFILRPACALPPLTPPVNVHAMVKAARMYGRY